MLSWFFRVFKGMIIALGFILPGVSGGVLAAILGVYEKLISFLAHMKTNFKEHILYFLPIGIGTVIGIALFAYPIEWLLKHYQMIVLWGFSGAILGTIPNLIHESSKYSQRDKNDLFCLEATFLISSITLYHLNNFIGVLPSNFISFVLSGTLISLGILLPGLSPSNLLLVCGLYHPMLHGFKNLDIFGTFLPIGIGSLLTLIAFSKIMNYILQHHYSRVYHFIIGMVLSTTLLLVLPNPTNSQSITYKGNHLETFWFSLISFFLGIFLGLWMSNLEKKYKL